MTRETSATNRRPTNECFETSTGPNQRCSCRWLLPCSAQLSSALYPFTAQLPPLQECQQKSPSPAPQFAPERWNLEAAGTKGDFPQIHLGRLAPDSSPMPGQQGQLLRSRLEYTYRHQRKHTCSEARITMQHDSASDFKSCNWLINGLLLTTFKSD